MVTMYCPLEWLALLSVLQSVLSGAPFNISSFNLDMTSSRNTGRLYLRINADPVVSTFDATRLTIQNAASDSEASYTLTNSALLTVTADPPSFYDATIILTENDMAGLQQIRNLATSIDDTFLSAREGVCRTSSGIALMAISPQAALRPSSFSRDTVRPNLLRFSIDIDRGNVFLFFSEPIDADPNNVDLSGVTLQNGNESSTRVSLSGATLSTTEYPFSLRVALIPAQLNDLKNFDSSKETFVTTLLFSFRDYAGNAIDPGDPIPSTPIDNTKLFVNSFKLKRDSVRNSILLNFSKAVSSFSLDPTLISLQSVSNIKGDLSLRFTLTGGVAVGEIDNIVSVIVNDLDSGNLTEFNSSKMYGFMSIGSNHLSIGAGMVFDYYDNPIDAISSSEAINTDGVASMDSAGLKSCVCTAAVVMVTCTIGVLFHFLQ